MDKEYIFDDWLNGNIIRERDYDNSVIYNDSEKYLKLVSEGKMTYDTLSQIQDAQSKTFGMVISHSFDYLKQKHNRLVKQTPDVRMKIESDIKHIENIFLKNQEVYNEVIYPVMHRQIKKGAKFITYEQYRKAVINNKPDIAFFVVTNEIGSKVINLGHPFSHEWIYCIIEVYVLWLIFLENEVKRIRIKKHNSVIIDSLENACKGSKEYDSIRKWFIDNKLCDHDTFIWKKGKTELVNYIRDLQTKGYTVSLKQEEIIIIALNSFRISISRRIISSLQGTHYTKSLPEIPPFKS
jgi:hypothetical protein